MSAGQKIKEWLVIIYLVLLVLIIITLLILLTGLLSRESGLSDGIAGGIIGSIGGIIGGLLTLFGVKWTIKNQSRERFIDAFPKKLLITDEVIERTLDLKKRFYNSPSIRSTDTESEIKEEIKLMIKVSSEVDGVFYNYSKDIELAVNSYFSEMKRALTFTSEHGNELTDTAKYDISLLSKITRERITESLENIINYRNKFITQYEQLTKI